MPRRQNTKEAPPASPKETSSRGETSTYRPGNDQYVAYATVDDDMAVSPVPGPSRPPHQHQTADGIAPHQRTPPSDWTAMPTASLMMHTHGSSSTPALSSSQGLAYPNASPPTSFSSASRNVSQSYQSRSIPEHQYPARSSVQQRRSSPSPPSFRPSYHPASSSSGPSPAYAAETLRGPSRYEAIASAGPGGRPFRFSGLELAPITGLGPDSASPSRPRDTNTRLPPITTLLYSNEITPHPLPASFPRKRVSIPELMNDPPTASTDSPLQPITPASARSARYHPSQNEVRQPEYRPHDPFPTKARETLSEGEDGPTKRLWPPITEDERQRWRATREPKRRQTRTAPIAVPPAPDEGSTPQQDPPTIPPRLPRNLPAIPWHRVEYDAEFLQRIQGTLNIIWRRFKQPTAPFPDLKSSDGLRFQLLDILHYLYFPGRAPKSSDPVPHPRPEPGTRMPDIKPEPDLNDVHSLLHRPASPRPPNSEDLISWLAALVSLPSGLETRVDSPGRLVSPETISYNPVQRMLPHELLSESLLMWCMDILIRADLSDRALASIIVYLVCLERTIWEDLAQARHTRAMRIRSPPLSSCQIALVACCSLATKFEEEKPYSLKAWSRITTLTLLDLLECEQHICSALKWNAWPLSLVKGIFGLTYPNSDQVPPLPVGMPWIMQAVGGIASGVTPEEMNL